MKRTTGPAGEAKQINFFVPFKKLDEEQRQVWGRATEESIDRDGEIVTYKCAEAAFDEWNDYFQKATGGKSQGNVREMHEPSVAGHVIATIKSPEDKAVDLGIAVTDEDAWQKCKAGDYIGLSIGGNPKKTHVEKRGQRRVNVIDELELIEVSLVDNPAHPKALFSLVKRAKPAEPEPEPVPTPEDLARVAKEADAAAPELEKAKVSRIPELLKLALEKQIGGPRSELFSVLPALEALRNLASAIDGEISEMTFGPAGGEDERGDIATLTAAAEAVLDFLYGEFQEQIRSLTGAEGEVMRSAQAALEKFLTLQKYLSPEQLKKAMSDEDLKASVSAMHTMGHAMVKATYAMGLTDCKVADPHGVAGDDDGEDKPGDTDGPDGADGDEPEKPASETPKDGKSAAKPEHREEMNAEKPVPKDTPGDSGVTMPHGTSDVERPSSGQQQRVPDNKKSAEVTEGLQKVLQEIADELKGIPALMKSVDSRMRKVEKSPAPMGRPPAPAEKQLVGDGDPSEAATQDAVHKGVVAELTKMAEGEQDPLLRQQLALKAATLAVKKVHSTGPSTP